ncbi:amino acid transporter [Mycolicibacterium sp. BK556]|uniref:APC family permease n=1 Tax=unclassified Mycolicibacterium TaxID=2636767 RepID=UPI00160F8F2A|nr:MULTISPECIES: APC family permease [unclassified Mycolicibacterium]MBB3604160.1 amino acid transporter [Mycolicibacterium sp. BK556]MBB3634356.1 amino acid transporter [Mycolicibacterium sp. BK607]
MTEALAANQAADEFCEDCGYEPELKRTLNGFQVFAISFASLSVAVGIFATYDDVLRDSGPVGIWLFPIVAIGQILVALVYAQFAARIPLSGSSYAWASRLASPKIGWAFGWLAVISALASPVTIDNALASQCLMPLLNMEPNETTARIITVILLAIQAVLAIAATRIVGWVNSLSVGVELGILLVIGIALTVAIVVTGTGTPANLFSRGITEGDPNFFAIGGGLMAASIMGLSTLVGFETASNMAEEAKNPTRSVPRAIIGSVTAASVLGMLFVIILTISITDMAKASNSESPVAEIMNERFGPAFERPLLAAITLAFFGAALVSMVSGARYIYAMSRDGRFPAYKVMRRVNPKTRTPIPATLLVLAVGVILMALMPGDALLQLILAGAIVTMIPYLLTIILYLATRHKLDRKPGGFDLGRWEWPVAIGALVWVVISLFVVIASSTTPAPIVIAVGLSAVGALYFAYMWKFDRDVLENEPGDPDMFDEEKVEQS